jgi:hypothetical protein
MAKKILVKTPSIPYEIEIQNISIDESDISSAVEDIEIRKLLIDHGIETAKQFINKLLV